MEFVIRSVAMLRWNGGKNVANEGILFEQGQTDED